jgi:hypothetical protein
MPRTTERRLSELLFAEAEQHSSTSGRWNFVQNILEGTSAPHELATTTFRHRSIPDSETLFPGTSYPSSFGTNEYYSSPARPSPGTHRSRTGVSTTLRQIQPRFSVPKPETYEYARQKLASSLHELAMNGPPPQYTDFKAWESKNSTGGSAFGSVRRGPLFHETPGTSGFGFTALCTYRSAGLQTTKFEKRIQKLTARCSGCSALGHRSHLPGCRFSVDGSAVSVGFVPCYKTH